MLFAESQLREGIKAPATLWRRLVRGRTSDLRAAINPERWKSELPNPGNLLQRSWTNVLLICSCIYSCCPESSNLSPIHLKWPCPYRDATKLKPVCKTKCCTGIFPVACVLKTPLHPAHCRQPKLLSNACFPPLCTVVSPTNSYTTGHTHQWEEPQSMVGEQVFDTPKSVGYLQHTRFNKTVEF